MAHAYPSHCRVTSASTTPVPRAVDTLEGSPWHGIETCRTDSGKAATPIVAQTATARAFGSPPSAAATNALSYSVAAEAEFAVATPTDCVPAPSAAKHKSSEAWTRISSTWCVLSLHRNVEFRHGANVPDNQRVRENRRANDGKRPTASRSTQWEAIPRETASWHGSDTDRLQSSSSEGSRLLTT